MSAKLKKVVAIPAGFSHTQYFVNQAYSSYVAKAGFQPMVVTPDTDVEFVTNVADMLLLPGGIDVDPVNYGMDNVASQRVDPARDAFERRVLHAFVEMGKPVFGICRGFQLMCYEFIISQPECPLKFRQHIDGHLQTNEEGLQLQRVIPSHFVDCNVSMFNTNPLEDEFVAKRIPVNSMHHQCVTVPSAFFDENPGWQRGPMKILARTRFALGAKNTSSIVEAVQFDIGGSILIGVQWHPEELVVTDQTHLNYLVKLMNMFDSKKVKVANG